MSRSAERLLISRSACSTTNRESETVDLQAERFSTNGSDPHDPGSDAPPLDEQHLEQLIAEHRFLEADR